MPHPNFFDLTNQKFDRLTVIERAENTKKGRACWKCQCICGNIVTIPSDSLRSGHTKSCGCLKEDTTPRLTHGMCHTPEFHIWTDMLKRCHAKMGRNFKNYGARGIKVCDEWQHNFMAFYKHIGKRPSPEHSIDRIENNSGYRPGNVRWATIYEQSNNTRNNHKITIHSWTMNLGQWAQFVGKTAPTIRKRLKQGWPPAKAVFYPVRHNHKPLRRSNRNLVSD